MDQYIIRKLLSDGDLNRIKSALNDFNCEWIDGSRTNTSGSKYKKCLDLSRQDPRHNYVEKILMQAIDGDMDFCNFCVPKHSSGTIIAKYPKGGYYRTHHDEFSVGNYSTTVFLNNPDEYEGGELCLHLNGREEKIKLDAGYAITYSTGILHKVNDILSGERLCSIFWTTSYISDTFLLELYRDLDKLKKSLIENGVECNMDSDLKNFEDVFKEPFFLINELVNKILRKTI